MIIINEKTIRSDPENFDSNKDVRRKLYRRNISKKKKEKVLHLP